MMAENCHSKLDLLKIDVEGAEYRVIEEILENKINIRIFCAEFDEARKREGSLTKAKVISYIERLEDAGLILVNTSSLGNYTFVNEDSFSVR